MNLQRETPQAVLCSPPLSSRGVSLVAADRLRYFAPGVTLTWTSGHLNLSLGKRFCYFIFLKKLIVVL